MNYPKMLYKGEPGYTDSAQIRDDLASRKIQTFIVQDEEQEAMRREQGWVDLADLMKKKPLLTMPKVEVPQEKAKRKYTRRAASDHAA
jgi:hypothetical protein